MIIRVNVRTTTTILWKLKYTPTVRSNILSKLIFLTKLCVILRSRVLRVVCHHLKVQCWALYNAG